MVKKDDKLVMNHEVVNVVATDMTEFALAVTQAKNYSHEQDALTAEKMGKLATRLGTATVYLQLRDTLRNGLDRAVPLVDGMAKALLDSAKWTTETDAENAMGLNQADGGR